MIALPGRAMSIIELTVKGITNDRHDPLFRAEN